MKIPVGNFGYSTPAPQQAPNTAVESQAIDRLGQAVSQVGQQIDDKQQELARAKDLTAYQTHALQVDQLTTDYKNKIASGEVPFDQAQQQFTADAQKIPAPQATARGPVAAENMNRGVQLKLKSAQMDIAQLADVAHDKELQSQGVMQLDALGKRAGLPGANIDSINAQADAVAPVLRSGGLSEAQVSHTLQDFKDRNWFNQAQLTAMQSRDSLPKLTQLEHDLTAADGFYANRMDTDKRNAVLSQVITHRMQLENKLRSQGDKIDSAAERALNQIDQQIASGVPATAEMWNDWGAIIKPSSYADQFKERQADEMQVQNVLRQPIDQQIKFVQDRAASLQSEGGSVRELTNLNRLKAAVQQNVQLLQQQPLVFNANRTGQDVKPLDVNGLLNGDSTVGQQIGDRMTTLKAMQKQYGTQVLSRPLLPQEAQLLTGLLDKSTPNEQSQIFAGLYNALGDAKAYQGTMQQIAPDAPVKAIAGMLAAKEKTIPLEKHWFSANVIGHSGDVSATMLQGLQLLSPTKTESGQDGKPKVGLYLPSDSSLQADFQNTIGTAFAGRPSAAENAFQAVKAYYVGRAAQTGRVAASNQDIDSKLVKESIRATLGDVVNYNGKGEVLAPWGMDSSTFEDKVHSALVAEGTKRGFTAEATSALRNVGLRNLGNGTYYVTQGKNFVMDPHGHPLTIDVTQ